MGKRVFIKILQFFWVTTWSSLDIDLTYVLDSGRWLGKGL